MLFQVHGIETHMLLKKHFGALVFQFKHSGTNYKTKTIVVFLLSHRVKDTRVNLKTLELSQQNLTYLILKNLIGFFFLSVGNELLDSHLKYFAVQFLCERILEGFLEFKLFTAFSLILFLSFRMTHLSLTNVI